MRRRDDAVKGLAGAIASNGGVALLIDYGHAASAPGDTLQAVRGHAFAPLLDWLGEQDLTSHVDFAAVAKAGRSAGAQVSALVTQGEWLNRLGLGARAAALTTAHPERSSEFAAAVHRLAGRDEMGELFKVLAIYAPGWPSPAGFE